MDDYPNSSDTTLEPWAPEVPTEQKEKEQVEESKLTASIPVIQNVMEWFEERARFYLSPDALDITEATDPEEAKSKALIAKKFSNEYRSELASFKAQFAKYLEKVRPEE